MNGLYRSCIAIIGAARISRRLDARGFTLLEVLIAVAVLALALPILLGLRNQDLDFHARAMDITTATLLAQEKLIEAEMSQTFPLGETGGDFLNTPPGYQALGNVTNRADRYRWKRIVTSTPLNAVREVKIQILWQQGGSDETLEVSTYVFAPTASL
ncbi:prepilin-type N-terminal cleavage/methylation domain-containing protein [Petrachloros mirabilis]